MHRTLSGLFDHYLLEGAEDDPEELQRVTDYIAGMTDRFAIATFRGWRCPRSRGCDGVCSRRDRWSG